MPAAPAPCTIASSLSKDGILDPLVEAPALQRVVHLARPVGGEDDERRFGGAHGPEFRES